MVASPARIIAVWAVAGAYFGLAALGEGGAGVFLAKPELTALAAVYVGLVGASLFVGGNVSAGVREDRDNRWVIPVFVLIGLLDGFLAPWSDRLGLWTLDGDAARQFGVALYAGGGALRLWPVAVLGHRFSGLVAIQPDHELVATGLYGVIRHPSYLGLLINMLGWGLAFRSGIGVLLAALMVPPLLARIRAEERLLGSQFGAAYEAYREKTWRLIPGVY